MACLGDVSSGLFISLKSPILLLARSCLQKKDYCYCDTRCRMYILNVSLRLRILIIYNRITRIQALEMRSYKNIFAIIYMERITNDPVPVHRTKKPAHKKQKRNISIFKKINFKRHCPNKRARKLRTAIIQGSTLKKKEADEL